MHIKIEHSEDTVFGNEEPGAGIDVKASMGKYENMLEAALLKEYRGAEIEIIRDINNKVTIDGRADHDEAPWIEQIIEDIWKKWRWLTITNTT